MSIPQRSQTWLQGYEVGSNSYHFPEQFNKDEPLNSNLEYKAGFDQGFQDAEGLAEFFSS